MSSLPLSAPGKIVEPQPWDKLQELLRPLSKYELDGLTKSIKEHNVIQEILVLPDGRIIDGYHRWKITNGKAPFKVIDLEESEAFTLGIILNLARRNMTPEQIKELNEDRVKLKKTVLSLLKVKKPQEKVSEITGVPQRTISDWKNEGSISDITKASLPDCRMTVPAKEHKKIYKRAKSGETQKAVAADYGVSRRRIGQIVERVEIKNNQKTPKPPRGKYNIILADPPWEYDDKLGSNTAKMGACEFHYPTMSIDEICRQPVKEIADKNCALFLWVTMPKLNQVFKVIEAWGFEYKTVAFVWVKLNPKSRDIFKGIGRWVQGNAELVLLATKGKLRRISKNVSQIVMATRGKHSKKPDEVRKRIVQLLGDLPRIELFAREKSDGWNVWGNEVGD